MRALPAWQPKASHSTVVGMGRTGHIGPVMQIHPPPMQGRNLLHKAQPQPRALLARMRPRQRVKLPKHRVLRVAF